MCVVKDFLYDCGHLRIGAIKIRCPYTTDKFLGLHRPTSTCPNLSSIQEYIEGENCHHCERRYELERERLERHRRQLDNLCQQNKMNRERLDRKWQVFAQGEVDTQGEQGAMSATAMDAAMIFATDIQSEYPDGPSLSASAVHPVAVKDINQLWHKDLSIPTQESTDWGAVYQHRESSLKSKTGSLRVNIGTGSKIIRQQEDIPMQKPLIEAYTKPRFSAFHPNTMDTPERNDDVAEVAGQAKSELAYRAESEIFTTEAKPRSDFFVDWTALQPRPSLVAESEALMPQKSISRRMSRIKSRLSSCQWGSPFERTEANRLEPRIFVDSPSTRILRNDSLFLPDSSVPVLEAASFLHGLRRPDLKESVHHVTTIMEKPGTSHNRVSEAIGGPHTVCEFPKSPVPKKFKPYSEDQSSEFTDDRNSLPSRNYTDRRNRVQQRLTQLTPSAPSNVSLDFAYAMVDFSARASAASGHQELSARRGSLGASSSASSWIPGDDDTDMTVGKAHAETLTPFDRNQISVISVMPRPPPKALLPPKPKFEEAPHTSPIRHEKSEAQSKNTVSRLDQLFRSDSIIGERQATLRKTR